MSALALAVLLSLISAVAYAGGAIIQERVAVSSPDRPYAPMRRPSWWIAVGLNSLGAALHVAALAFGPLSVVQPLGALTIVFALPMAALFVGRGAGPTAWRGAIMATVGLAGLLALTDGVDSTSLGGSERLLVAVTTFGAVVALMIAAHAVHRHPVVRSVLLAGAAGIAFGMASVFTKSVAVDLSSDAAFRGLSSLAVIAVLATGGLLLSQASYRGAGLAAPLAVVTVVNPVAAAAVGLTLFGESFRYGTPGTVVALVCGVVAAGGLILLTTERIGRTQREPARSRKVAVGRKAAVGRKVAPHSTHSTPHPPLTDGAEPGAVSPAPAPAVLPLPEAALLSDAAAALPAPAALPEPAVSPLVPDDPAGLTQLDGIPGQAPAPVGGQHMGNRDRVGS
ncbi:DMT family transporter [Streptomyces monticola]|uniref:DMT family transporter n=1 Tax=Streptomyces monticola TaxID=2666263 RepID=A0ABW2JCF6_9ACTN